MPPKKKKPTKKTTAMTKKATTMNEKRLTKCHPPGPSGKGEPRNTIKEAAKRAKKNNNSSEFLAHEWNSALRIRIRAPCAAAADVPSESNVDVSQASTPGSITWLSGRLRAKAEARAVHAAAAARNLVEELREAEIAPSLEEDLHHCLVNQTTQRTVHL